LHYRIEQILKSDSPYAGKDALEALLSIFIIDATRDLDPTLAIYDERIGVTPTPLYHAIGALIERHKIDLLILDSAADLFAEEINRHAVRSFIRLLRELGCTVILLAHPSASGLRDGRGYSGSTHWNNSVRARLYFRRAETADGEEPDPDLRILEMPKNNRARADTKIFVRWQEGRFVPKSATDQSLETLRRALKDEELFMQLLTKFNEQGRKVSPNKGPTYAPKIFAEHPDAEGISPIRFLRAQQILLDARKIKVETGGPPSRRYSWLEVAQ
jgi:RecA-family ATPase